MSVMSDVDARSLYRCNDCSKYFRTMRARALHRQKGHHVVRVEEPKIIFPKW